MQLKLIAEADQALDAARRTAAARRADVGRGRAGARRARR